jgi:hypothetical protein
MSPLGLWHFSALAAHSGPNVPCLIWQSTGLLPSACGHAQWWSSETRGFIGGLTPLVSPTLALLNKIAGADQMAATGFDSVKVF